MMKLLVKRIVIICEIFERDFSSRNQLAVLLRERYPEVEILVMEQEFARCLPAFFFRSTLVYDKSASDNPARSQFFARVKGSGGFLFVEDEEGLSVFTSTQRFLKNRVSAASFSKIDRYMCWNETQHKIIAAAVENSSEKMIVAGASRYHLLPDVPNGSVQNGFVLFNSNFSILTNYSSETDFVRFRQENLGIETSIDEAIGLFREAEKNFSQFCSAIRFLEEKGEKVIVRPHPSDNKSNLAQMLVKRGVNRHVISDIKLSDALVSSKALIHANCGSSIEAAIYNVPSLNIAMQQEAHLSGIGLFGTIEKDFHRIMDSGACNVDNLIGHKFELDMAFANVVQRPRSGGLTAVGRGICYLSAHVLLNVKFWRNRVFRQSLHARLTSKWLLKAHHLAEPPNILERILGLRLFWR